DLVLPLNEIPAAILRFTRTQPRLPLINGNGQSAQQNQMLLLQKIFAQLRAHTARDFSGYKQSTIMRRIQRRLQLHQIEELPAYLDLLRSQPEEVRALADDLLVTVTSFFRDPAVFEALEQQVIPKLFEGKGPEDYLRVWSVGCATGEEVYSLAILLLEYSARCKSPPRLQLLATDLHEQSLETAREGFYPSDIRNDTSPERLQKYFQQENDGYRILKEVRELVVFAPHNLLGDPPFSRIDLVSCRNMLIYLRRSVQREVFNLFHYAMRPSGYLVLGSSESLETSELFQSHSTRFCIYRRQNVPAPEPRLPLYPRTNPRLPAGKNEPKHTADHVAYGPLHHRLVEQIAPPSVLVTPDDKVVHLSEHAGRYLSHPGGQPTTHILKLVRAELRNALQTSLMIARERKEAVRSRPALVQFPGTDSHVVIHVRPALEPDQDGYVLVMFDEWTTADSSRPSDRLPDEAEALSALEIGRVRELEDELEQMRQRLQTILEEDETGREELKASNEELQSANEELRSTLEELETSQEELQSMNEELQTVNQENRHKVAELAQLTGDLQNLMAATDIATLFLDRKLRIVRFTPQVGELFNVRHNDRGRPLSDLTHRLGYPELEEDALRVLERLTPVDREIQSESGQWYLTRVRPYRSTQDRIEGVVITFVDLTDRKKFEEDLQRSETRLRRALDIDQVGVLYFNLAGRLIDSNDAFLKLTSYTRADVDAGSLTWRSMTPPEFQAEVEKQLEQLHRTGRIGPYEKQYFCKDGSRSWMMFSGAKIDDDLIVKHCIDIGERKRFEEALLEANRRKDEFLAMLGHELRNPLAGIVSGTQALGMFELPAEIAEIQQVISRQASHMTCLVDDLLDVSRIARGRLSIRSEPTELRNLLQESVNDYRSGLPLEDCQLECCLPEEAVWVNSDRTRLSQAVSNVLHNAVKFSDGPNHVKVELTVRGQSTGESGPTGRVARISIRDQGIGMTPETLATLFEPFSQADTSIDRSRGGLGLGLALVRGLVNLHHGQVCAESAGPGQGSNITLSLPLVEQLVQAEPQLPSPQSPPQRVLLIDDRRDAVMPVQRLLELDGHIVHVATRGAAGIALAHEVSPEVILCDIGLDAEMSGYDVARSLRSIEEFRELYMVALTGYGREEDLLQAREAGFNWHLTKPAGLDSLRELLSRRPRFTD
ncbi:MAG: PAS domain-containing protein, partial [Planctomycetaceae bacterium]|nr:PAS domain-containing protein [Planctomycetaceae bacterium]